MQTTIETNNATNGPLLVKLCYKDSDVSRLAEAGARTIAAIRDQLGAFYGQEAANADLAYEIKALDARGPLLTDADLRVAAMASGGEPLKILAAQAGVAETKNDCAMVVCE